MSDIVVTIGEYVDLEKNGLAYFGICPFHYEKTPSFSVSPEKQLFHCFGCGVTGDESDFLERVEKIGQSKP